MSPLFVHRSAFFWFSQDERKKVRAANPKFGVGEVAKELGRRWADIDPESKKKYEGLAEEDRKRYSQAKIDYKASLKTGGLKKPATPLMGAPPGAAALPGAHTLCPPTNGLHTVSERLKLSTRMQQLRGHFQNHRNTRRRLLLALDFGTQFYPAE